jgi:hypothetical protein
MEVFGTIAWICLALIPGFVASKKGYSFWAYFLHGVFPSFITALITLNIAENMQYRHTDTPAVETQPTDCKPYHSRSGINKTPENRQTPPPQQDQEQDILSKLGQLHELRQKGAISEQEYQEKKAKLLSKI